MSRGWNAVPLIAFILAVAQHSYLGLRVVVEDYAACTRARGSDYCSCCGSCTCSWPRRPCLPFSQVAFGVLA